MVARLHDTFYDAKATLLSEADIKEIRESRGRIPYASKKMADKFHIGPKRVYEIWDNKERLQQGVILDGPVISSQPALDKNSQTDKTEQTLEAVSSISLPATEIPKKNGRKKKVKIDEKPVTEATSMVEKNNKNGMVSSSDNSSDTSREDRVESLFKNLVNRSEKLKLKSLTANTTPLI
ncbi:4993_t:CDS:1 [Funneliformis geosporum]|uniref:4993_t:CDS:1 n=1 Tax=Funneliformis geosporum TaxID=1117311 RepID=A0A9W4T9N4_9GLOM|nr:4993_t:CDS:1 [Funneliformis geosporum]